MLLTAGMHTLWRFLEEGQRLLRPVSVVDGPAADAFERPTLAAASMRLRLLVIYVLLGGMAYGAVVGAFPGHHGPRPLQMLFSAVKVPLLLLVSFGLTLPSFFVLNTLAGLRGDFHLALRAIVSTQAALAIILAGLGPLTAVWYLSSANYPAATLFNGLMFAIASFSAQWPLRRRYEPLIRRNPRHRVMLVAWLVVYVFVAIQMAWVLRPFLGDPDRPTAFFRQEPWGNAYVVVFQLFGKALGWGQS